MPRMPHVLTYDTLPPHSTLRREISDDVVKITAAAEEPGSHAKRIELQRAALSAALLSGALLVGFILAIGSTYRAHRGYMGAGLFTVLVVAFAVFCAALFLLLWKMQYASRIDALERAFRQTTILAASPGRLLIETAGPFGQASHDLDGSTLSFRRGRWRVEKPVDCLDVMVGDDRIIQVLPGRDEAELRWVARTLRTTIGV